MKKCESPVFIVGGSRSGTSLLAAMLNGHSSIACGTETQILKKIHPRRLKEVLEDSSWPDQAVKNLSRITLAGQRVIENFGLSEEELREILSSHPPGVAALFESIAGQYAYRQGKTRWAEKTPRHLLYLDTLREAFPQAKIIRIMRDPRDAAISMCQLPWASDNVLTNFYIANDWYNQSDSFFSRDSSSKTVVYENLIKNPEVELRSICEFIEEDFEAAMLDTRSSGTAVATKNEHWKKQVSGPLDSSRLFRWKREMSEPLAKACTFTGQEWLKHYKYPIDVMPDDIIHISGFYRRDFDECGNGIIEAASKGTALPLAGASVDHEKMIFCLRWSKRRRSLVYILKTVIRRALKKKSSSLYVPEEIPFKVALLLAPFFTKVSSDIYELTESMRN